MIEEFDSLAVTTENYKKLTDSEQEERHRKREQLLAKMSKEELQILIARPYPSQYKSILKKYLDNAK
jgi:hypothetical protein